jgi:hypothetical protein
VTTYVFLPIGYPAPDCHMPVLLRKALDDVMIVKDRQLTSPYLGVAASNAERSSPRKISGRIPLSSWSAKRYLASAG